MVIEYIYESNTLPSKDLFIVETIQRNLVTLIACHLEQVILCRSFVLIKLLLSSLKRWFNGLISSVGGGKADFCYCLLMSIPLGGCMGQAAILNCNTPWVFHITFCMF